MVYLPYVAWMTQHFPVKAGRNELKGPNGCLRKLTRFVGNTKAEVIKEAKASIKAGERIAPNSGIIVVKMEIYNSTDWNSDPFNAMPVTIVPGASLKP
jgi:hypothetical protein